MKYDSFGVLLETGKLTKSWYCRPAGALGTCGYHPFAWTIGFGSSEEEAIAQYERTNAVRSLAPSVRSDAW